MFAPEYFTAVTLRVKKYLLDEMRESFGEYASILHDEDVNYVRIRVRVGINRKFYLWLMQYGDGVELVSPAKERAEYLDEVRKMQKSSAYDKRFRFPTGEHHSRYEIVF